MPKKQTKTERFIEMARRQFKRSCVPTVMAICISVGISKIGLPIVPIVLISAGSWAWWRGYKVQIVKPEVRNDEG